MSIIHNKQSQLFSFRYHIRDAFVLAYPELQHLLPFDKGVPVKISISVGMVRPKSNKNKWPCGKVGDVDKMARAILDACTELIYYDDCQVVELSIKKEYKDKEFVTVEVSKV